MVVSVPRLTFLKWLDIPQATATVHERFRTFSVIGDNNLTARVLLEKQSLTFFFSFSSFEQTELYL